MGLAYQFQPKRTPDNSGKRLMEAVQEAISPPVSNCTLDRFEKQYSPHFVLSGELRFVGRI
jgi:hypothetical protein